MRADDPNLTTVELTFIEKRIDADFFCGYRPLCKSFLTNIDV
ncbi:hypothetical protein ACWM9A_06025 [Acetobacter pasteurianus]